MATSKNEAAIEARMDSVGTSLILQYYELTKPGISKMVMMTTLAGYYLAIPQSSSLFDFGIASNLAVAILGTLLISSGSCVANHIIERDVDARMKRTSVRPIPSGAVSVRSAVVFSALLSIMGAVLLSYVNTLTLVLALITWVVYVLVYTPMKTRSSLAVIVGGIPGALPFMGGWTAQTGTLDPMAWILFAILFFWQLPHFYALSWMYRNDYREGGMALRAIDDESGKTLAVQMIATSVLTLLASLVPTMLQSTGMLYAAGAGVLGLYLTFQSFVFYRRPDTVSARRVLLSSYAVLMGIIILMFIDKQ
ncbi:MAG: protoheme IX farnesyltransferase [Ignavibacteria bacterium]|nr:protoheme IX farnesyltransferase [Ignavibacteria bacterium]